jgi:hypothetical protein
MKKILFVFGMIIICSCHKNENKELIKSFSQFAEYSQSKIDDDFHELTVRMIVDSIKAKPYYIKADSFFEYCNRFNKLFIEDTTLSDLKESDKVKIMNMYHSIFDSIKSFFNSPKIKPHPIIENKYEITGNHEEQTLTLLKMLTDIRLNISSTINFLLNSSISYICNFRTPEIEANGSYIKGQYTVSLYEPMINGDDSTISFIDTLLLNGKPIGNTKKIECKESFARVTFPYLVNGNYELKGVVQRRNKATGILMQYPYSHIFEIKN